MPSQTLNISINSIEKSGPNYSVVFNTGGNPPRIIAVGANPDAIVVDLTRKLRREFFFTPPGLDSLKPQIQSKIDTLSEPAGKKIFLPAIKRPTPSAKSVEKKRESELPSKLSKQPDANTTVQLNRQFGVVKFIKGDMALFYDKMLRDGPVISASKYQDKFKVIELLYQKLYSTAPFQSLVACGLNYAPDMGRINYDEKAVTIMQDFLARSFLKGDAGYKKQFGDVSAISQGSNAGKFTFGTARALSYYFWVLEGKQGPFKPPVL
ncbi:MAG: hypothetical protein ABII22_03465 [Candidatus Micrarchaeota archaeon]